MEELEESVWNVVASKMNVNVRRKMYMTLVRSVLLCGTDTSDVADIRMLLWMYGVTKLGRISNERIMPNVDR